jgi:hypothetical protein
MVTLVINVEIIPEPIDAPSFVVSNKIESLEFLSTTIPLTPPQIGVGPKITLISNTPHAFDVFTMLVMTFEETFDQQRITTKIGIQILSQVEPMEEANVVLVIGAIK